MFTRLSEDESLHLDVRTYNIMIGGLCRHSLVDEAYDLFRKMGRNPLEAVSLIQEMVSKGFSADATTLFLLIELLPKNQLDHPLFQKLLGDCYMVSEKIRPTKSTTSED
ncbi:Pentatricopeptide repeat-containing protein At3g22470, mitochondrial [Linum perenne]